MHHKLIPSTSTVGVVALWLVVVVVSCVNTHVAVEAAVPNNTLYFFPSECSLAASLLERQCCPLYRESMCGSAYGRGACAGILTSVNAETGLCNGDVPLSIFWFNDYFNDACICSGNYWGVACELCAPGWGGDDCMTALPLRVRRDIDTLSTTERQQVVDAFYLMRTTPHPYWPEQSVWQWMVSLHQWSTGALTNEGATVKPIDYSHDGPALLVWHRAYQYYMEYYMMDALNDPTFTIPYWNYSKTGAGTPNDIAISLVGGDGDVTSWSSANCSAAQWCRCTVTSGPFADWTCIGLWGETITTTIDGVAQAMPLQRAFDCIEGGWLPSEPALEAVSHSWSHFEFTTLFQGMHGAVHRWLGYTMAFGSPPSDPIFFLYHAYVDLQMEKWIRLAMQRGVFSLDDVLPEITNVGHSLYQCSTPIVPLLPNTRMLVPTYALGYTYDYLALDPSANEPTVTTAYQLPLVATPTNATAYQTSAALVHTWTVNGVVSPDSVAGTSSSSSASTSTGTSARRTRALTQQQQQQSREELQVLADTLLTHGNGGERHAHQHQHQHQQSRLRRITRARARATASPTTTVV